AGVEILKQGGNVVDAAVATAFALAVVRPASCGIGGGGFMVIWDATKKQATAIDYREQAPRAATREMYFDPADPKKVRGDASRYGHRAVAVPCHVAGLCLALEKHGSLHLRTVLAPALRLCREGFEIDPHDREVQQEIVDDFRKRPEFRERYATLYKLYLNGGQSWKPGEKFRSPLGSVLERIADDGADGFHRGPVARAIVEEMRRGGGLITLDDLAGAKPVVREPLAADYRGLQLLTMPPPSSGGVALLETLRILDACEQRWPERRLAQLPAAAPERLHLLTEAFKHAFADRAAFLGDTDFADVPVQRLISDKHAGVLASRIDPAHTLSPERYGRFTLADDRGTSHFSIIDAAGNAVACTETINWGFGSLVVEPEFGIILNNEMDDFTAHPDLPNAFGLKQSEANSIAPGKRPLSSMTPTILIRDGKAVFALGASGGPRIITATTQVLLHLTRDELNPKPAVEAPRLHHQWLPDRLDLERGFDPDIAKKLETFGHAVRWIDDSAVVQAVSRRADGLRGASDPRKHGKEAGY
ncbi:MAG TPA: gamma-glutamyltransferase, partial [Planctomycetaceae bacterium]|nr:gamma-glutamyltransferase [Planctomycetaceae bacterium]